MKTIILNLIVIIIFGFVHISSAQIIYTDINPDTTISVILNPSSSGYYYINLDNDTESDFSLQHFVTDTINFKTIEMRYYGKNPTAQPYGEALLNSSSFPMKLYEGDPIDSNSDNKWGNGTNTSTNCEWVVNRLATGSWHSGDEGYLGLRNKKSEKWHYGWLKMSVMLGTRGFIVMEYAWNKTPKQGINAGQKESAGINENDPEKPTVFPNPFKSSATFQFNKTLNNAELNVYNTFGQKVKTVTQNFGNKIVLEKGDLIPGLYIYKINQNNLDISAGTIYIMD